MRMSWSACLLISTVILVTLIWITFAFQNKKEHARHIILNSSNPEDIFEALIHIPLNKDSFILQIATDKIHRFDGTAIKALLPHLQNSTGQYYQYLLASIEYFSQFSEASEIIQVLYKRLYNEKYSKNHPALPALARLARNYPIQFIELLSKESNPKYRIFLAHEIFCKHKHSFHYYLSHENYQPLFTSKHTDLRSLATMLTLEHTNKNLPQNFLSETLNLPYDIHILAIIRTIDIHNYAPNLTDNEIATIQSIDEKHLEARVFTKNILKQRNN